jgi:glycosyltransferase involved in cell wall biosynthesis
VHLSGTKTYRVGFFMSQNLGHIVHDQRMRLEVAKRPRIQPVWMPILPWNDDRWQKLPLIRSNFTLLSGFRARDQFRRQAGSFSALYCHTQEAAVLLGTHMKRIPTILSLDATPINMDSFGHLYGRGRRSGATDHAKFLLVKRSFELATHLVTFNNWARDSLIRDYGIPVQKITVNPPGPDLACWNLDLAERSHLRDQIQPHVLFVGGSFVRKGGETLLRSAASLRDKCIFDIVTSDPACAAEGLANVRIHRGLEANSPELLALYRQASIFALPTLGDCSPWSIVEAMAMQLPVVATSVGGISDMVAHGETGLLIAPASPDALRAALSALLGNAELCRTMGAAGRKRAECLFDGQRNYGRLITLIERIAARDPAALP